MQRLELPAELDITAEAFASTARAATEDELVVAGADVRRIDAAGLQLLYAVICAARVRGARVVWDAPSRVLVEAARITGLDQHLGL